MLKHLAGMPGVDDKWRRAAAPLSQDPPIVELLGYFMAGPSPRAQQADPSLATSPEAQAQDTIWVVLRWDGMAPVQLYPASQQTSGLGLGRLFGGEAAAKRERARMLRAIAAGALRALAFVHGSGVVHGAIGSGSVLLSTFDDSSSMRLAVKLDNVGRRKLEFRCSSCSACPSLRFKHIQLPDGCCACMYQAQTFDAASHEFCLSAACSLASRGASTRRPALPPPATTTRR